MASECGLRICLVPAVCALATTILLSPTTACGGQVARSTESSPGALADNRLKAAAEAAQSGDFREAVALYRKLEHDPDIDVRCEARYQHSQLLAARGNYSAAALLLRALLDEKPDWQRARMAFAHALAMIGREPSARRELRQSQVTPLPVDLQPQVETFSDALLKVRPIGGTIEVAFAPNSSIDRASSATLLSPEILPFSLTRSPPVFSGNGLRVSSQIYGNVPIASRILATAKVTLSDHIYQSSSYDDHVGTVEAGIVAQWHRERLRATIGDTVRLYGTNVNSQTIFLSANWLREIGTRDQIEIGGNLGDIRYEKNKARDGKIYVVSVAFEHAFAARSGGRLSVYAERETATAKGYASNVGGASGLVWHELGKSTVFASVALQHLVADGAITPQKTIREDWLIRGGAGVALRKYKIFGFAPSIRASYTRNLSNIVNQRHDNPEGEFALNRPF